MNKVLTKTAENVPKWHLQSMYSAIYRSVIHSFPFFNGACFFERLKNVPKNQRIERTACGGKYWVKTIGKCGKNGVCESCLRRHFTQFFTPIFLTFQKEKVRKSLYIKDLRTFSLGGTTQIWTGESRFCRPLPYHLAMVPSYKKWSGWRGSNSLPPPWQGGALPDELHPHNGAFGRNRTNDTRIFSPLLYQLSYKGKVWRPGTGSNRRPLAWQASVLTNWTTGP